MKDSRERRARDVATPSQPWWCIAGSAGDTRAGSICALVAATTEEIAEVFARVAGSR